MSVRMGEEEQPDVCEVFSPPRFGEGCGGYGTQGGVEFRLEGGLPRHRSEVGLGRGRRPEKRAIVGLAAQAQIPYA